MSHFTVMVIGENPEGQLAPYQENNMGDCPSEYMTFHDETTSVEEGWAKDYGDYDTIEEYAKEYWGYDFNEEHQAFGYWENPNRKWDWYQLGGRWRGFLKLKPQFDGAGIVGERGVFGGEVESNLHVDQALKGQVDFEGMIADARATATKEYDSVAAMFPNKIIPKIDKSWDEFLKDVDAGILGLNTARDAYHAQPAMVQWKNINEAMRSGKVTATEEVKDTFLWNSLSEYQASREDFIDLRGRKAIITFALLIDGKWNERGEMGWWGCVSNEMDEGEWVRKTTDTILALPDDTLISVYDCHI